MAIIKIGTRPPGLIVKLTKDAPLSTTLIYRNAAGDELDWPTAPTLTLGSTTFTATAAGSIATLAITPAQIAALHVVDSRAILKVGDQVLALGTWGVQ